jgi:hypothetical protein
LESARPKLFTHVHFDSIFPPVSVGTATATHMPTPLLPRFRAIFYSSEATPGEITAASELARLAGADTTVTSSPHRRHGLNLALASRGWTDSLHPLPPAASTSPAWIWIRVADDGTGEILATHGSFLFAAVRLLAEGVGAHGALARDKLAAGVFLPATFSWNRPHWDACLAQYWRSARGFDSEHYLAALAASGFTHAEVNSLQAHMPYEDAVPSEYYPQFYTYLPGFNHFVDTPLTAGMWPAMYLDANLEHLKKLAGLARRYGLKPGVCMFEPRTMPERFFQKYPTLRGARVDHPFRSRLPRFTMAQDHPIVQRHYREALQKLIRAVPDLSYLSVWTNDSGAGFEHTASLYVGRNGGPYLIREWRNHDKVAEAAGQSIVRYLQNLRSAAAELNPEFDVILRIEPFKVEHDHIKSGMGSHVSWEAPSLLVRGYSLPYAHPKYPDNPGVAGSIFHPSLDPAEAATLERSRANQVEPVLHYSASGVMNHEPLLGLPFPRLIHAKLSSARTTGLARISALGGLANIAQTPYWPNPIAIQAAQFFPDRSIDDVLDDYATRLVGPTDAPALGSAWKEFEDALIWQPLVPLFCSFGFCWQRTWDRPFVPDIEAIPAGSREYYERHGCFQHHNPGLNDFGKDVLFDLITRESGAKMAADMDRELLPRVRALIAKLESRLTSAQERSPAHAVFIDLRDRVRGYLHWATTLRNVCAWCEHVYTYLAADADSATRAIAEAKLQTAIDLELENTRGLIALIETTKTEFMVVSAVAENTFLYGENLIDHLRTKVQLTEKYRHHRPRIDRGILWRPAPGTTWPEGW